MIAREIITDRIRGCLYGQAIGDALGLGTEFMRPDEVMHAYPCGLTRYDQIIQDHHRSRWVRGAWTDDTDMMLCILRAAENGRFNIDKIARNSKDWFNGVPLGIGSHTFKVLCMADYVDKPEMCSKVWWEISRKNSAANGALMRTSVIGLIKNDVARQAEDICRLTHYDPRCVGSCVISSLIINNIVWHDHHMTYDEIIAVANRYDERISEWVTLAHNKEDIKALCLSESNSIGYTLRTLSAALWCYWHAKSFAEGLLAVVNEGGDADTNGAISCAILGAKFGVSAISRYYIENLHNINEYDELISAFIGKVL